VNDVVLSYGYKKEDLIGKSFLEFVPFVREKHRPILEKHVASITNGEIAQGEMELSTPKGRLTMWFRASPMKKRGEIVGFQLILIDITKRKKAEEALKESEQRLRDVIDTSPDGIVWVDTAGKITLVNKKGFEITGFSRKDLIGKNFIDVEALTQESKEKILESFMKRIEGIDTPPYEVGLVTKNGEVLPFELSASPIYEGEKIVGVQAVFRDLRERKRAEEILRESEEKYRKQFEETLDAIFLADAETGIIIDCNRAASELIGREKSELVGKHQRILHPPQKIEGEFTRTFKQHLKEKEGQVLETQVITKKGEIKDVAIKANVFELKGKKLVQWMFRDITERKQMEEKLRESEETFRNLYESIQDPVGIFVGREGRLIECNKAFKKLAGYSDEELKDKIFLDFVHPEDQAIVLEKYQTKYSEEELPLVYEIRAVNKKGEIIPLEISVSTYKKKGRVIGIEIIHRDITERKQMEEKLKESEERLRNLYESIPDALAVYVGREGHLIEYNNAFKKWSGYSDEELKDKIFLDFVHPEDQAIVLEKYRTEYSEEELPLVYEIKGIKKKGETIPTEISVGTYKKKGRVIGINVMHRDITERKEMERKLQEYAEHQEDMVEERTKELRESQERLIKSERLATIGQLATMVGHDLRNPLAALKNASYYLKMKLPSSKDEKVKKMFGVIDKEINYANNIVKDLMDFSRVKKPELKKVDLISSIQDAVAQLKFPENITLTTKFSEAPAIEADPDQLRRIFQNITLNGVQAMLDGGELTVSTRKNGDFVEVAFTDTGVGIPEENMEKLFTPLFTTKSHGVGLGLPICKNLVDSHNGRIEVNSKVGKGTTFTLKLPIHQNKGGEKQT
jgi:PAS domain S-box-containing protein